MDGCKVFTWLSGTFNAWRNAGLLVYKSGIGNLPSTSIPPEGDRREVGPGALAFIFIFATAMVSFVRNVDSRLMLVLRFLFAFGVAFWSFW